MSKKLLCLTLLAMVFMAAPAGADTLTGLADVTVVDGTIVSLRYADTEYVVADGDLVLGTTTRWYVDGGVETLWTEGDPAPAATVSGTSSPKDGDVGSKADNFLFTLDGSTNISSIDGIDFQETIFPSLTDTIFVFERNGNDNGTVQAILADGSLGTEMTLTKNGEPYASTGVNVNGQTAYGYVVTTDVPVQGVRITASGHDALSISTPKGADAAAPEQQTITIVNPGFEDPVLAEDDWTWLDVPGWTWIGGEGPGIWHVTSTDFDPVVAPEGQNVLYTENAVGDGAGVAQVLTETFAADTDYTLTVEVGNSNYYYNGGYSVQLLAGETVIAEDNDTLWPDYKTWATSTVAYTYDPADSGLVGQPLEIRLLNLGLDKDNPPENTVGVEFDNVTLVCDAGAELGVTIAVDPASDLVAANELAQPGDTIEFAEGTYILSGPIDIKEGVTYKGAGAGLTIIDGNDVTRAFTAWGDLGATNGQVDENGDGVPNLTGPTRWVLDGLTIQNCVADAAGREDILSAARDLLTNYAGAPYTLETAQAENGGITNNPEWFDLLSGGADDDLTDAELQAYLDDNPVGSEGHIVVNEGMNTGGAALILRNGAAGTVQNCSFLNNQAPLNSGDGGAINAGLGSGAALVIDNCEFNGNSCIDGGGAMRLNSGSDCTITGTIFTENQAITESGDGGAIMTSGSGVALIIDDCEFNGNACIDAGGAVRLGAAGSTSTITGTTFTGNYTVGSGDGGAIRVTGDDSTYVLTDCSFIGNTAADDGGAVRYGPDRAELTVTNCAFIGNGKDADGNAVGDDGGAWSTNDDDCGPMTFANCLFADNASTDDRVIEVKAVFAFLNCTFIDNEVGDEALIGVRGRDWDSTGDGTDDATTDDSIIANCLFINNTLLSNKEIIGDTRNDVFAPTVINCLFFGNLDQNGEAAVNADGNSTEVGTIDVSAVTDAAQIVVDNRPVAGSPAIDASDPATATASDIEGTPAVGVRDVGAYEAN